MALMQCTDCGADVSEFASCCPKCGAPVQSYANELKTKKKKSERMVYFGFFLVALGLFFQFYLDPMAKDATHYDTFTSLALPLLLAGGIIECVWGMRYYKVIKEEKEAFESEGD